MTQIEINKHKTNICNLAMKLSNTFNIYEEISINNEIKKETEFLESLLNIKNQQNMLQPLNQMMPQQMQQQMLQQQFQQMMLMQQQMFQQQMNITIDDENWWDLTFEDCNSKEVTNIRISNEKLVKEAISMYMLKSGRTDKCRFIFNNKNLFPEIKIKHSGLNNKNRILVLSLDNLRGG